MTAWGVGSLVQMVSTTQSGLSDFFGDCRERPAIGGYFSSVFLNCPVSILQIQRFRPFVFGPQIPVPGGTSWERTESLAERLSSASVGLH